MANLAPELIIDRTLQAQADGVVVLFETEYAYQPGTVLLYLNGQALAHGFGIEEVPPQGIALEPDTFGRQLPPHPESNLFATYHA